MFILNLLLFIIVLGLIIFIHELGHYYFARKAGILVHEFSLGMGPLVYGKRKMIFCMQYARFLLAGMYRWPVNRFQMHLLKKEIKSL